MPAARRATAARTGPIVIGSGPAGLVAAYFLAEHGYRPMVLERGRPVRDRIHDVKSFDAGGPHNPESNYLFGEGGAGTFSDGKLTCRGSGRTCGACWRCSPSARASLRSCTIIGRTWAATDCRRWSRPCAGASRPGAARCVSLAASRISIWADGQCARARHLVGLSAGLGRAAGHRPQCPRHLRDARAAAACRWCRSRSRWASASSSRRRTSTACNMARTPLEDRLGAADYTLVARGQHDLFTFCMCAGGHVMPSVSEPGYFCTNGMSLSRRDSPFANSGLMVTVPPEQFGGPDVLAGMRLQQIYEQRAFALGRGEYLCPIQRATDFLARRPTRPCRRRVIRAVWCSRTWPSWFRRSIREALRHGLPHPRSPLARAFPRRGHARRARSPRQLAGAHCCATTGRASRPGLRGCTRWVKGPVMPAASSSAAVDGLRTAKAIVAKYAPLR